MQHALSGVNAAVVALILSSVIKLGKSTLKDAVTAGIFLAVMALSFFAGWSPVLMVVLAGAAGWLARRLRGLEQEAKS